MGVLTGSFSLGLLEKGSKGAKLRMRVWTEGDIHLEGKEGEGFYDVVRYENNQLYLCIKTVGTAAKKGVNDPVTSIQKHLGYWTVAQNWEFVATKLLLAEKITADMIDATGLRATQVDISGKITATEGEIYNVTVSSISSVNGAFSIDSYGNASVEGLTSEGGTFNNISATDGTFTRGTFTDITSTNGTFTGMTANGGTFDKITATDGTFTRGTFNGITAEGGTFNNITSDGGTFTNVDVTGKITATSGSIDNVTVSSITSKNGNFSIDANGDAAVTNITATGGTFTQGTFENITLKKSINTVNDNLYIDASGNVSVKDITSTNGTFNNMTASGGTFTNIIATDADISGKITATSGTIGGLTISENTLSNKNIATKPKLILMNNELSFYKIFKVDTDARDTFVTVQAKDTNAVQVTTSAGHLGLYIGSTNGGSLPR